MLSHETVWAAIDALASRHALSPSALAKKAGLDSTAFNRSKRRSSDGRLRWPSTESLAKIFEATGASFDEFVALVEGRTAARQASSSQLPLPAPTVPLLGFAQAGGGGFFDDAGFPVGQGWEMVEVPSGRASENAYALEVQGDSMLPLYRGGDILIVDPVVPLHKGDRVVARTRSGEVMAKVLSRRTPKLIELSSLNPDHPDRKFAPADLDWLARILWASQ